MRVGRPKSTSGPRFLYTEELRKRQDRIKNGEFVEPLTQNGFWYHMRTIFLKNGIDPQTRGKTFRKNQTNSVIQVCKELGTTREDLNILASSRAFFYYEGERTPVSLSTIKGLILKGTDIIIIEKEGLCELLFNKVMNSGIALLDTKGFAVEYAKRLSGLSQSNISLITDFDDSGMVMYEDVKKYIPNVYRIGIDLKTVEDLTYMYGKSPELTLENVQENYRKSWHWGRLQAIYAFKTHETNGYKLDDSETPETLKRNLNYLRNKRIEIDSIENAIGIDKFWEFIKRKLSERFPIRDYNRAIKVPKYALTETMNSFQNELQRLLIELSEEKVDGIKSELKKTQNIIDTKEKFNEIYSILSHHLSQNPKVMKIDAYLKDIMKKID